MTHPSRRRHPRSPRRKISDAQQRALIAAAEHPLGYVTVRLPGRRFKAVSWLPVPAHIQNRLATLQCLERAGLLLRLTGPQWNRPVFALTPSGIELVARDFQIRAVGFFSDATGARPVAEVLPEVRALVARGPFTREQLAAATRGLPLGDVPWEGCDHDRSPAPSDVDPSSRDRWSVICLRCGATAEVHGAACRCAGCTARRIPTRSRSSMEPIPKVSA